MHAQYAPNAIPSVEYKTIWFTDEAGKTISVPTDPANTDYANIMALVAAGELTIAPAEGA